SGFIDFETGQLQHAAPPGVTSGGTCTLATTPMPYTTLFRSLNYQGTYTGSGAGTVLLATGTLLLAGDTTFNFPGSLFQWNACASVHNGTHLITSHDVMKIAGSNKVYLVGNGALTNKGTINQT